MRRCIFALAVLCGALSALGARYQTTNFIVRAPSPQLAQQVGQAAEYYRAEWARAWLGHELPPWPAPLPISVRVTGGEAGGATTFAYDDGQILDQQMTIEGRSDRIIRSALPHEITHTIFAAYFRQAIPRWADEGGAVLSEDDQEKAKHEFLVRQYLSSNRAIPLRRLFRLRDYPRDILALYAEGYSVAKFLVQYGGRPRYLAFIADGMRYNWDYAVQVHYGLRNVEELERSWRAWVSGAPLVPPRQQVVAAPAASPVRTASNPAAQPLPSVTMVPMVRPVSSATNAKPQPTKGGRIITLAEPRWEAVPVHVPAD